MLAVKCSDGGEITIKIVTGKDIASLLPFISEQRLKVFREYPYLYEGSFECEKEYLEGYNRSPNSAIAVAYDDGLLIGFLTGMPLKFFEQNEESFKRNGLDAELFYYFGEVIVLPQQHRKSICMKLFEALEEHVKKLGYSNSSFLTIITQENNPMHPINCEPIDILCELGYSKSTLTKTLDWLTVQANNSSQRQSHTLVYWIKKLK